MGMSTKEFLTRSRDRIKGHWTHGKLGKMSTLDGEVCAVGGMLSVLKYEGSLPMTSREAGLAQLPCMNELLDVCKKLDNPRYTTIRQVAERRNARGLLTAIEVYNDGRREVDVIKLFDAMIEKA